MTDREFQIFYRDDLAWSKLTVTPSRVTLKINSNDRNRSNELIHAAHEVAGQIDLTFSVRGRFRSNNPNSIYMTSSDSHGVKPHYRKTYYWESPQFTKDR